MAQSAVYETRTVEPISLDNGLILDGESERGADGEYLKKTLPGWEQHYAGSGKRLPTVGEYITAIKQLDEKHETALQGILKDLREDCLCAGKIDYSKSNIPIGYGFIDQLVKDPAWCRALEDEVFHYDAGDAVGILQRASGKRPYIRTPSVEGRKLQPELAAWLYTDVDRFVLNCDIPFDYTGTSRGVRVESK